MVQQGSDMQPTRTGKPIHTNKNPVYTPFLLLLEIPAGTDMNPASATLLTEKQADLG